MTTPERPTDPAWAPAAMPVEPGPAAGTDSDTAPVVARLPISPKKPASGPSSRAVNIVLGVAAVIAISGVAFAAGRMTAPATDTAARTGNGAGNGRFNGGQLPEGFTGGQGANGGSAGLGGAAFLRGAGVLEGTIVAVTSDSITLQIATGVNGGQGIQIVIPMSSSTAVHSQASATTGDLANGQKVLVQLGTATPGATAGPIASGAPREVQAPASNVTIEAP